MKNLLGIALLMSLVLAIAPAEAATKVFLLGGQSNMAGCGITAELVGSLAKYNASQTGVSFWNCATNGWVSLRPGFGGSADYFGPEVSFGYAMRNAFPTDDIYLVKYGVSGSMLADNPANPAYQSGTWASNATKTTTKLYPAFKSTVDAAIASLAGKDPVIAGMLWMQGESDTYVHADAAAYQTNLTQFIAAVRNDFHAPNMEFVLGRITTSYGASTENGLVRAAQVAVPGVVGNAACFNTDDLQGWQTGGHYNTQGQINLGNRFANAFIQTPEPSSLVLLGTALAAAVFCVCRKRRP